MCENLPVRRLLQLGTLLLVLATILTPLLEFFDRWDAPGPDNDTELAVFGFVLLLCLVLAVCKILGDLSGYFIIACVAIVWPERRASPYLEQDHAFKLIVPPIHNPLQI